MQSALDIIRSVVGTPLVEGAKHLTNFEHRSKELDSDGIEVWTVELPLPEFRGIKPNWTFVIHDQAKLKVSTHDDEERVLRNLSEVIDSLGNGNAPILVVSNDRLVRLNSEFSQGRRSVFYVDASDLAPRGAKPTSVKLSPIVGALRRKLALGAPSLLGFSPYQRGKPVSGWQFFGRERELNEIVNTEENVILVGARRVGKTSLMQEAARQLELAGERVFQIDVQNCITSKQVVDEIIRGLSQRDAAAAIRHGAALGEAVLSNVLRRLGNQKATIFLDEIGNVISSSDPDDWRFFGTLRKYCQQEQKQGKLRIILSCFQEVFLRQQVDFQGPLVNFARTMRLSQFRPEEVEEFILAPLEVWKPLSDRERKTLLDSALSLVGCNPYLLQYYCWAIFENITRPGSPGPSVIAQSLLRERLVDCFSEPVDEVFYRFAKPTVMYLFLKRCIEADQNNQELRRTTITDEWLDRQLAAIGYKSTLAARRNVLEGMEILGLTTANDGSRYHQTIATPIVYVYVKRTEPHLDRLLAKLQRDINEDEATYWNLEKLH